MDAPADDSEGEPVDGEDPESPEILDETIKTDEPDLLMAAEAPTPVGDGSEMPTDPNAPVADAPTADPVVDPTAAPADGTDPNAVEPPVDETAPVDDPTKTALSTVEQTTSEASIEAVVEAATDSAATADVDAAASVEAATVTQENTSAQPEQKEQEAPMTAAVTEEAFEAPADRRPTSRTSAVPVAITAGADLQGYTAGSTFSSMTEVSDAFTKRLHALRRVNGGDGEQHIVASLTTTFPEERTLNQDSELNLVKIRNVTSPEALVASGGHVAPLETNYDIFGVGTDARPVRDALARFQADRGGIRYIAPPVLTSYTSAVGVWTNAVDILPGGAVKASLTVAAATEKTAVTDAVTVQLQFGNLLTRAYPELVQRHNELGLIQHARQAELNLLSAMTATSTAVTTSSLIGFGRDFLVQIGRAGAAYRSRHRMSIDTPLRAIVPSWVNEAIRADLVLAMPGDNTYAVADSEIAAYVSARNINLTASLDQDAFGAQGVGVLLEFPDSFTWHLFAEGSFLFLDGGTLDLGIIRDSTLVGTNDYKMFLESFEAVAFVGVEALVITSAISVNGAAAALRDTTGGAVAAAIEY